MDTTKYQNPKSITQATSVLTPAQRISTTVITIIIIMIMLAPPLLSATTSNHTIPTETQTLSPPPTMKNDLLIILSPAYTHDPEIIHQISKYAQTIYIDINWTSRLITLLPNQNTYPIIDNIIEHIHQTNQIKACLLIGDDLDLPIAGTYQHMEKPSIKPYATLGGNTSYHTQSGHIISTPYKTEIFISLLIPNPSDDHATKKQQIITTLESFITKRNTDKLKTTTVLESSALHTNPTTTLNLTGIGEQTTVYLDPTLQDIKTTVNQQHSLVYIHGHSDPSKTLLNHQKDTWFTVNHLKTLHTPVFLADGCYVNGQYTTSKNQTTPSYSSILCENPEIQMMILGIISQTQHNHTTHIHHILSTLSQGTTIAESFLGHTTNGDIIFYGDPTFHFTSSSN